MVIKKELLDFSKFFFAIADVEERPALLGDMIVTVVLMALLYTARSIWLKRGAKSDAKKVRVSESHLQDC